MLTVNYLYESVLSPEYQYDNYGYYQQPNRSRKKDWILPVAGLAGAGAAGYWLYNRYGHANEVARQEQDAGNLVGTINRRMSAEHDLNRMNATGASAADIKAKENELEVLKSQENRARSEFGLQYGDGRSLHPDAQIPSDTPINQKQPEPEPVRQGENLLV